MLEEDNLGKKQIFSAKMAVAWGEICSGTGSKINVIRSTIYMESFVIVSQIAQFLHYEVF